jgi:glycosyltransferase involved in cell wall biosynthesis
MNSASGFGRPAVSIILPTFNRAKFVPQAFAAIAGQRFTDWELIVVDDGSTDNTRDLVARLSQGIRQPVRYVHQKNQGAYGARNTGLDMAEGDFIAFYDSDDVWLPHHLANCLNLFEAAPEVDWVYGACRVLNYETGQVLSESTFLRPDGQPRGFLRLHYRPAGLGRVIEDAGLTGCMLEEGLFCGLQNSVIRRCVFEWKRFKTDYRNEAEDVLFAIRALLAGHKFGYLADTHVIYHVHGANSSAAGLGVAVDKQLGVFRELLRGFEEILRDPRMSTDNRKTLSRSLSRIYFWTVGYSLLWQSGRRAEAMPMYARAMQLWPCAAYWKHYTGARLRLGLSHLVKRWLAHQHPSPLEEKRA